MKLREYITEKDWTMNKVAKKIGIASNTLYRFMNGECSWNLETAMKIEKFTGGKVTCQDLYYEYEENRKKLTD